MGVTKTITKEGNGPMPQKGQTVAMAYTGWVKDTSKPFNRGKEFDSSIPRGDLETRIGVGQVIRGWDEAIMTMKLGEKATLDISSDYAYGERGFPGAIPENAALIFDVELKNIK